MRIISFTGPKGSGKDTAAQLLLEAGISSGKISFAGPMKEIFSRMCEIPLSDFEDPMKKEAPFEDGYEIEFSALFYADLMREMMQVLPPNGELKYSFQTGVNDLFGRIMRTPRELLQFVGTEVIRNRIHPDWHVAAAFRRRALSKLNPEGIYCVTDARFPNEYKWLTNRFMLDFSGFYVERPEAEELLKTATHQSELQVVEVRKLMTPEQILNNSGTLESLRQQILERI